MMINKINDTLNNIVNTWPDCTIKESVKYSLLDGGKRIRPLITSILTQDTNLEAGLLAGSALEMIHTYSLIHDDLPAMDDDDYRRHKLTNHKVFGEDIAILAGDTLLTESFGVLNKLPVSDYQKVLCLDVLIKSSGIGGMILGQQFDIQENEDSIETLNITYKLKTGALFAAAFSLGAIINEQYELLDDCRELGELIGIYFQYQDDLLELTSNKEILGKDTNSDSERNKPTINTFLSYEKSKQLMEEMEIRIKKLLHNFNNEELNTLMNQLFTRKF